MNVSKATIFIDGENFYRSVAESCFKPEHLKPSSSPVKHFEIQSSFDLLAFCKYLSRAQELTGIYFFDARLNKSFPPKAHAQQFYFFKKLRETGEIELFLGKLETSKGVPIQKFVDVSLATEMIKRARMKEYNIGYLVSGDKDFTPAVNYIQSCYKKRCISYVFVKNKGRFSKILFSATRLAREIRLAEIYRFCSDSLLKKLKSYSTIKANILEFKRRHKSLKKRKIDKRIEAIKK